MQICLQWILFATRPLEPQELYFAIQFGLNEDPCSGHWDREAMGMDDLKVFVRHSSKGLAEVTRNKTSEVQFIHESVRDFLLGKYGDHWAGAGANLVGHGHELLRDCCLAQLLSRAHENTLVPNQMDSQATQSREHVKLEFPFLEYSVLGVLHHANSAQQHGMDQVASITERFPSHFQIWLELNNFLEKHAVRRYGELVSLVYILAEKNLAELIKIYPRDGSCFDVGTHDPPPRYGPPIFAALTNDRHDAARALLEAEVRAQPPEFQLQSLCKQYFENERQLRSFGRTFTFRKHKGVLSHLVEHGDEVLFSFLLLNLVRFEINSRDTLRCPPLVYAAKNRRLAIVELLLKAGADLNSTDGDERTALSYAAANGDELMAKLLLDWGAGVDSKDRDWHTPLWHAVRDGNANIVKLLLDRGAESDSKTQYGETPLAIAAMYGRRDVVELLLDRGAEVDSRDIYGRTPLSHAASAAEGDIVKVLRDRGAEIDSKDHNGRTPLSHAVDPRFSTTTIIAEARKDQEATVRVLLKYGADARSKDNVGQTPMSRAARREDEVMMKLFSV
jgi:ankyrin repeat protein